MNDPPDILKMFIKNYQLEIKDRLDDPQKYIDNNFGQIDRNISQIEKLLDIKKSPKSRVSMDRSMQS